ncbi:MAG: rhodanese-like domain-containing protein [Methylomonas sp.]|nr:rhodanese-like domain-containing protein [Methylomonas sp.]
MKILTFLFIGILFGATAIASDLQNVTPEQLREMQDHQNALIIDVRTDTEWQASGVISNSHKLQAFDADGKFDQQKWLTDLEKLKSSKDQAVILVCRSGKRSAKVGAFLAGQLGMKNVYHLENGLQSWIASGHPVSPNCLQVACK